MVYGVHVWKPTIKMMQKCMIPIIYRLNMSKKLTFFVTESAKIYGHANAWHLQAIKSAWPDRQKVRILGRFIYLSSLHWFGSLLFTYRAQWKNITVYMQLKNNRYNPANWPENDWQVIDSSKFWSRAIYVHELGKNRVGHARLGGSGPV